MIERTASPREVGRAIFILTAASALPGCAAYHVVSAPVKVAATTVLVTSEAAGAAVKATGKIAVSAINAAGDAGSGGIDAAAQLTRTGMVTFVDVTDGSIVRVPWRSGFTVAAAGAEARIAVARRTIDVVRSGSVVFSATKLAGDGATLAAGDVVRLRG